MSYEFQSTLYDNSPDAHRAIAVAWLTRGSAEETHAALSENTDVELERECWEAWFLHDEPTDIWQNREDLLDAFRAFRAERERLVSLNCHHSGELQITFGELAETIGFIDDEGDLSLEEGCPFTEDEISDQIRWQMSGRHPDVDAEWIWDDCYYRFLGVEKEWAMKILREKIEEATDQCALFGLIEKRFDLDPSLTWLEEAEKIEADDPETAEILRLAEDRWYEFED